LIVVRIGHVVKAKVARAVLREKKFFCGADLVEKLGEELVMLEALRDLVALNSLAFIA